MRNLSIRLRLTIWYTLVLALILLCFGLFLYFTTAHSLHTQVDTSLQLVASQAAANLQDENGRPALQNSDEPAALPALLAARGYAVRLMAETGQVLDGTGEYRRLPPGVPAPGLSTCTAGGEPWRLYTVALTSPPDHEDPSDGPASAVTGARAYLQVAQSLAGVRQAEERMRFILAIALPLALVLAAGGGAFLADRALRPIDHITREARRIRAEDLGRRLNLTLPDDEVGRLARTFDEMLTRLEEAFRRERQFTADAAHELRTPLTVLKGSIGVALNRPRTAAQYLEVLRGLEAEVDRLIALAEDLLALARSESGSAATPGSVFDLTQVTARTVEQLRPFAHARNVSLELDPPFAVPVEGHASPPVTIPVEGHPDPSSALPVAGDPDRVGRALYNLIHNAIKYTGAGGHVHVSAHSVPAHSVPAHSVPAHSVPAHAVSAHTAPAHTVSACTVPTQTVPAHSALAEVTVTDDGPGISPEDLPQVFERFFRGDRARTRTGSEELAGGAGAGLGLTIARAIARAHGGDITVISAPGRGSTFTLRLPLALP